MTGIDRAIASALASRIDSLIDGVTAGSRATAAQTGTSALSADTPLEVPGAVPLADTAPPASAQAVLSEVALTLDAISRFGGEATPAVIGEAPIWPAPPAINVPAAASGLFAGDAQAAAGSASTATGASAAATAASGSTALTATTAAQLPVDALAAALEQTVADTGLFYESHLAGWLSGRYSAEALANEPQTRLAAQAVQLPLDWSESADAPPANGAATGNWPGMPPASNAPGSPLPGAFMPPHGGAAQLLAAFSPPPHLNLSAYANPTSGSAFSRSTAENAGGDASSGASAAHAGATLPGAPASMAASIHPATIALVRQQLDLLATQQFRWTGEVWPGAKLDWTIEPERERERGAQSGEDSDDGEPAWRTRITLALPTLGTVDADLALRGTQLVVRVLASPGGAARLATGGAGFGRRLEAAGIQLAGLSIREIGGTAPAAGGTTQAATSAYARAAAEAADAEARDAAEPAQPGSAEPARPADANNATRSTTRSPLDRLFDDPFDWSAP